MHYTVGLVLSQICGELPSCIVGEVYLKRCSFLIPEMLTYSTLLLQNYFLNLQLYLLRYLQELGETSRPDAPRVEGLGGRLYSQRGVPLE